jgi:hypothetical protein
MISAAFSRKERQMVMRIFAESGQDFIERASSSAPLI